MALIFTTLNSTKGAATECRPYNYDQLVLDTGLGSGWVGVLRAVTIEATTKSRMVRIKVMIAVNAACSLRRRAVCR